MKRETIIEYAEFALSPSRSRCELFVSAADGAREKLASGLIKPFIAHLQAAEQQLPNSALLQFELRRDCYSTASNERNWFTKGTLERFVRFVSTPEVLERIKSIEDEITQLEEVRSIQASSLGQAEDGLLCSRTSTTADGRAMSGVSHVKNVSQTQSRQCPFDVTINDTEASKKELLRAMDVRIHALRLEQETAFARACKAGFDDDDSISDLVSFADYFGANRLREACLQFSSVRRKRESKIIADDEELNRLDASSSGSNMSFTSVNVASDELPASLNDSSRITPERAIVDISRNLPQRSSSPRMRRRLGSPLRRVQIGRSGRRSGHAIRSINYNNDTSSSDSNNNETDCGGDENPQGSATQPLRRLSVQEAISLFESKRKESNEALGKRVSKQAHCRLSAEDGFSAPGKSVLRRWSGASDLLPTTTFQQQKDFSRSKGGPLGGSVLDSMDMVTRGSTQSKPKGNVVETEVSFGQVTKVTSVSDLKETHSNSLLSSALAENVMEGSLSVKQEGKSLLAQANGLYGISNNVVDQDQQKMCSRVTHGTNESVITMDSCHTWSEIDMQVKTKSHAEMERDQQEIHCRDTQTNESVITTDSCYTWSEIVMQVETTHANIISDAGATDCFLKNEILGLSENDLLNGISLESRRLEMASLDKSMYNELREYVMKLESSNSSAKSELGTTGESLGSSWNNDTSHDLNIQFLVGMVDNAIVDYSSLQESKGRLYEQYRILRDAKFREEKSSERAEREAKLNAMKETLARKKTEMEARNARIRPPPSNRNGFSSWVQDGLPEHDKESQKEEEKLKLTCDEGYLGHIQEQVNGYKSRLSSSVSSMMSSGIKEERSLTRKNCNAAKKGGSSLASHKSVIASTSPKHHLTKNAIGTPGRHCHRQSVALQLPNNVANKPCFVDLRKENTKPSLGRFSATTTARVHPRSSNYTQTSVENVNSTPKLLAAGKGDKKQRSMVMRKSFATLLELRALSSSQQGQDKTVLASSKAPREIGAELASVERQVRQNAVAPIHEIKPFLRKGRRIGAGVMKLKPGATKSRSDGEVPLIPTQNVAAVDSEEQVEDEAEEARTALNSSKKLTCGVKMQPDTSPLQVMLGHDDDQFQKSNTAVLAVDGILNTELPDTERIHPSLPIKPLEIVHDLKHKPYTASQLPSDQGKDEIPITSLIISESTEAEISFVAASSSFCASSLHNDERNDATVPCSPLPVSPPILSAEQPCLIISNHQLSPQSSTTLGSSTGNASLVSWNPTQGHSPSVDGITCHARKFSGILQKSTLDVTQSSRDPAMGFKKLLKFGRKSRLSETTSVDGVAASTTSEGDDDADEKKNAVSRSVDDLLGNVNRVQNRKIKHGKTATLGDLCGIHDEGAGHSLQSSIPNPPATFKLREDRSSGGSLLKAPRSFFSLSTFRSRSSNGKTR